MVIGTKESKSTMITHSYIYVQFYTEAIMEKEPAEDGWQWKVCTRKESQQKLKLTMYSQMKTANRHHAGFGSKKYTKTLSLV